MPEPMSDERLAEIERKNRCGGHALGDETYYCGPDNQDITDLLVEVRRLRTHKVSRGAPYIHPDDLAGVDQFGRIGATGQVEQFKPPPPDRNRLVYRWRF